MTMPSRFRLLAPLFVVLLAAGAACSSDDSTVVGGADPGPTSTTVAVSPEVTGPGDPLSEPFTPASTGTLVTWSMRAGECSACGFELRLDADGTATYRPDLGRATVAHDASVLSAILAELDPASLVTGTDDCGREVDGNAPSLTLHRADGEPLVLDTCYLTLDREHPLLAHVFGALAGAEMAAEPVVAAVTIYGGLCPEGECRTVYTVYADGSWTKQDGPEDLFEGGQTRDDTRRLLRAVADATRDDIVAGPFTGECPTAVDGQARTYVLYPSVLDRSTLEPTPDWRDRGFDDSIAVDTCREELRDDAEAIAALDELIATTSGG